jgi:hypothetical protein
MPPIPFEGKWRLKSIPTVVFQRKMLMQKKVWWGWKTKKSHLYDLTGVMARTDAQAAQACIDGYARDLKMYSTRVWG